MLTAEGVVANKNSLWLAQTRRLLHQVRKLATVREKNSSYERNEK